MPFFITVLTNGPFTGARIDLVRTSKRFRYRFVEQHAIGEGDGVVTDPAYLAYTGNGPLDPTHGGYNPNLVAGDLVTLFTNGETNYSALSNLSTLEFLSDPVPGAADFGGGAASLLPMDLLDIFTLGAM